MRKKHAWFMAQYILLGAAAIIVIVPLYFTLITSIKTPEEIFSSAFRPPRIPHFENYFLLFNEVYHLQTYFLNSVFYAIAVCCTSIFVNTMAAYAIARMKWKLSKLVMVLFLAAIMVPGHATMVPLYVMTSKIRIPNQAALMLIFIAGTIPVSVFLITGYLSNVPKAMEESAVIDGSSIPNLFFKIIIPIIKPPIATITIFNFMSVWNDLMLSLIFLSSENIKTLQLGIMKFRSATYTNFGIVFSAMVVSIVPIIIVYLFMSEKIIGGITAGAVKG
ncbi:MAG: carbohydrate ABC transporter permease [Treponema sp.]|jgi:raffinose/stachyose/melibiose transport system permease protein|nr:carbohydrate ABC transporter permease [Treponema sp.]